MSAEAATEEKIKTFGEWMEDDHVLVHLDTRVSGVEVPKHLTGSPNLSLKLSYLFQGETKHDEHGVSAYLRFSGEYFRCVVPWEAVWAISSSAGEMRIWKDSIPKELAHLADTLAARAAESVSTAKNPEKKPSNAPRVAPSLSVVEKPGGKKPPALKRIK